jgi:uncharacterized protein
MTVLQVVPWESSVSLYAIADLHLGFAVEKPMDIFGEQWKDHARKIETAWKETVEDDDTVLIPGDISWAMTLEQARADLDWIHTLPGRKILLRGNHDYWWSSLAKVRNALPISMTALQNDHLVVEDYAIAGTRGWNIPVEGFSDDLEADRKIFERERGRLELSLSKIPPERTVIAMTHFPPVIKGNNHPGFSDILEKRGVRLCVYGHYHGADVARAFQGELRGVRYVFCAADGVDFRPVNLGEYL